MNTPGERTRNLWGLAVLQVFRKGERYRKGSGQVLEERLQKGSESSAYFGFEDLVSGQFELSCVWLCFPHVSLALELNSLKSAPWMGFPQVTTWPSSEN